MEFYRLPVDEILLQLQTRPAWLSADEVRQRQGRYGFNVLETQTAPSTPCGFTSPLFFSNRQGNWLLTDIESVKQPTKCPIS